MRTVSGAAVGALGLALLLLGSKPLSAAQCPTGINADHCSANDLQVTGVEVVAGPAACTEGELVTATVQVQFEDGGGANDRYDLGFFIGDGGEEAVGGASCTFAALDPLAPPLDTLSGFGGFEDLDGDACGDLVKGDRTHRNIQTTQLLCQDKDGDGKLDASVIVSWDNRSNSPPCTDPSDPAQFQPDPPRCLGSEALDLPIDVETAPVLLVSKVPVPAVLVEPGGDVTFFVSVHNASSAGDAVTVTSLVDTPYGDLDGRGTCAVPFTLAPGESWHCRFSASVTGSAGDIVTDTVVASGQDNEGEAVSAQASADVRIVADVPPVPTQQLHLIKLALPQRLPEPGGMVNYTVLAYSLSGRPLSINRLEDDLYGDLNGQGSCRVPIELDAQEPFFACQFPAPVNGQPGDRITDIITASGTGVVGSLVEASDTATVQITDLPAELAVSKIPTPASLVAPGGAVTFSVQVQNLSVADAVELTSLNDSVFGNLDGAADSDCSLPQTLAAGGGSYTCRFTRNVSGTADTFETNVVTAVGTDDDGQPVQAQAAATVNFVPPAFDILTTLRVQKTAQVTSVLEPGRPVRFGVELHNNSPTRTITVNQLVDSVHGNLDGQGSCALPMVITPAEGTRRCEFVGNVVGAGGEQEVNLIRATGVDDHGAPVFGLALARVVVLDTPAVLGVVKAASRLRLPEPGGAVDFTITAINASVVKPLRLDSLVDSVYGDLNGQGSCSLPQSLPSGGRYQCRFRGTVSGVAGDVHRNEVRASASTARGAVLSAQDQARVLVIGAVDAQPVPLSGVLGVCVLTLLLAGLGARRLYARADALGGAGRG